MCDITAEIGVRSAFGPGSLRDSGRSMRVASLRDLAAVKAATSLSENFTAQDFAGMVRSILRTPVTPHEDGSTRDHPDTFMRLSEKPDGVDVFVCAARSECISALHVFGANVALQMNNADPRLNMLDENGNIQAPERIWQRYAAIVNG
ncbi:MAG: hypothetical protein TR69_WS6001000264 [candidate division WS6 bacterium OLB20]|uniref:Uncharacterized protein n=1 Tax=candidate division WS6 bacterium OLB20 TaxID=1617426 RepID=A0A136M0F4_9BACT|nr:MAG: hypothetical protein TR69_WS6001000264 [candidate division WS6 bacterium OLB20]